MLTAIVALLSILLGCVVLIVIQLGVVIFHLGELRKRAHDGLQHDQ